MTNRSKTDTILRLGEPRLNQGLSTVEIDVILGSKLIGVVYKEDDDMFWNISDAVKSELDIEQGANPFNFVAEAREVLREAVDRKFSKVQGKGRRVAIQKDRQNIFRVAPYL